MTTIRVMTYNIQRCRGGDGRSDPDRIREVIAAGAPDIVALQQVSTLPAQNQLQQLGERLGMHCYPGLPGPAGNAFLSYHPLRGIQEFDLGGDCSVLRADVDLGGKRLHLFNLRLETTPRLRRQQIDYLLGPTLLGNRCLTCPTLVLGDFGDLFWGPGNVSLNMGLRRAPRPLWHGTYPSRFPVAGRDRAYLKGDLRILHTAIDRHALAREASSHLPLTLTLQIIDPRNYLRLEKLNRNRMEIAPG
ncbi:endonuclease [Desulfuromonas versatilis]|uniref:Endonuclease n=1 Tax=Desulfuromonas versatilis TaxID=2802975 RepID=A0ABN6DT48_9BACT|nr:endonuclease/exonuclease/phosphatase family protein [Desulfuromonas versatilis]BCR02932.1 endonuclease [Desulfuromonas versatilis]